MDDFFKIEAQEPYIMSQQDFFEKTKKLLKNISDNYSQAWQSRSLKDDEFPDESICDKCKGNGVFKLNGEDRDCVQDREQGWCYYRFCDYEQLGIELETHLEDIFDLLSVDKISNHH